MRVAPRIPIIGLAALSAAAFAAAGEAKGPRLPENLAPKAKIAADSEYSGEYLARFVADGVIPEPESHADPGKAWCVRGDTHRGGATLRFDWDAPVTVAEIVYFARTAWFLNEGWKGYEVRIDGAAEPAARGELAMRHGPQAIRFDAPRTARALEI
ncbi:MAG: hypothetical protein JXP34_06970, partial [Planctomycetes bacterium]|nr:hypothetical protein [Planctomycetota bacterium]